MEIKQEQLNEGQQDAKVVEIGHNMAELEEQLAQAMGALEMIPRTRARKEERDEAVYVIESLQSDIKLLRTAQKLVAPCRPARRHRGAVESSDDDDSGTQNVP